jgi:hypothetical protein
MMSMPTLSTIDHDGEAADIEYERYLHVASKLDLGDVLSVIGEELAGDSDDTPLSDLLEEWTRNPEPDWDRPAVSVSTKERIGDYVVKLAAKIMERHLARAMARSSDTAF